MNELNNNLPLGGLNQDDEDRSIPAGDYRNARNIRNSINSALRGKALTNVKGNLLIEKYTCPYNGGTFPGGTNVCIGAGEDKKFNTIVFMLWNSNSNHGIYRFYRDKTNPDNPYGEVEQIMQYDFGWTRKTRITSINIVYGSPTTEQEDDLIYWCDPVPKKINITKGNIVGKHKSWNIYLPKTFAFDIARFPTINLRTFQNQQILNATIVLAGVTTNQEALQLWANSLNNFYGNIITAKACDCHLEITEVGTNSFYYSLTDQFHPFPGIMVPDNWYGSDLVYQFFDRCKYPALYAPQAEYAKDAGFLPNYVDNKVFQFRLEYQYDDFERASLGVWSQIPINNIGCDGTADITYNYIDVNFNDPNIALSTTLTLLKNIRFVARQGNTAKDRAVITLKICDFLNYNFDTNTWFCDYSFYNNIASEVIDDVTASKLFDNVPLTANAELFTKDRIVEAGILEGYDTPECPKVTCKVRITDTPQKEFFSVTFRIRILTYGLLTPEGAVPSHNAVFKDFYPDTGIQKYPFWQAGDVFGFNPFAGAYRGGLFYNPAATEDADKIPFFGGGSIGSSGDFGIRSGMTGIFDQRVPDGFVVYSAGTKFFANSQQISIGLPADGQGNLDVSNASDLTNLRDYYFPNSVLDFTKDVYSEVTVRVPRGLHTFRMPSHWCSFGDKLGKGFMYDLNGGIQWQKTSTNIQGRLNENLIAGTGQFVADREYTIDVQGDIPYATTFIVTDVAPPFNANISGDANTALWIPINGYLYDSLGNSNPNGIDFDGVSAELSAVFYGAKGLRDWEAGAITDCNGYFFGIAGLGFYMKAYQVSSQQITDTFTIYTGSLTDLINKTLSPYNISAQPTFQAIASQGLKYFIVPTTKNDARHLCSTFVEGNVLDQNGVGIPKFNMVLKRGKQDYTNSTGLFQIIAWGDMQSPNAANFSNGVAFTEGTSRNEYLYYQGLALCDIVFLVSQIYFCAIDPLGEGGYTPENPFFVPDYIVQELMELIGKARKRGGNYIDTMRLYDTAGRLCSCFELYPLYIPFETENLKLYPQVVDALGNPYTVDTYFGGKPTLKWAIDSSFKPPAWAAYYQFMRTKNLTYGRYLQWAANQVTYLSAVATLTTPEIQTAFQNGDAVAVKISLSNLIDYSAQNPTSQLGYEFNANDRLRLMYKRNGDLIEGLYDFQIISYDSTTQSVIVNYTNIPFEIQSGFLIEIYDRKQLETDDQQIQWEVGEVFPCTHPGFSDNEFSVPNGTFTNGDTYWRGRAIPVNDDITNFAASYPAIIESESVSDFYISDSQDIGRPGIIDLSFKQIYKGMLMRFSNLFIPSTAINGLSSFEELNQKELDRSYGQIERLFFEQNNLICVNSNKEISNYIGIVTIRQAASDNGLLSISDQFFGTDYIHSQNLGTDFPASCCVSNSGRPFGWTNQRANVWKYQNDGEQVISDIKMINFFKELSNSGVSDAVAVYDRWHEEYILTYWKTVTTAKVINQAVSADTFTVVFENTDGLSIGMDITVRYFDVTWKERAAHVVGISGTTVTIKVDPILVPILVEFIVAGVTIELQYAEPETISWQEGTQTQNLIGNGQRWRTFYDFKPECYSALGAELFSFKDGKIWIHDKNDLYNNFYGVQYQSLINPVFNQEPLLTKVWNSLWMMQYQVDNNCNWYSDLITNTNNQLSRLKPGNFVKQEENWYAFFKRDLTDVTVQNPIINGRALRSSALSVELKNDSLIEVTLYGWRANWTPSQRTIS